MFYGFVCLFDFLVKQVFYRNLVLTKHFVEILTILWTFALFETLLISMDQTSKWLSLDKNPADQSKVFSKLYLVWISWLVRILWIIKFLLKLH